MSEWTSDEINREWDERAEGKYGAALEAESFALMADVLTLGPPRLDPEKWIAQVKYKPGWSFECFHELHNQAWVFYIYTEWGTMHKFYEHDLTFERCSKADAEREMYMQLHSLISCIEHDRINELFDAPGKP